MSHSAAQPYSLREEAAHAATHGIGTALSIAALTVMVIAASASGDPYRIVAVSIFGASMVVLYLTSTLYHAIQKPNVKHFLRLLDHSSIYLLIAGTYTPFTLIAIRGGWGWSLFGVVWGLALFGIFFSCRFIGRFGFVPVAVYLAMGWLGIIAAGPIIAALSTTGIVWLAAGGLLYTIGVVFYIWKRLHYHHAIWHLFVLGGTTCHFLAIYYHVLPKST